MDTFNNLFPKNLYHSYIVEGDPEITSFLLREFLEERGEISINSSDVLVQIYDSFTIDNVRKIKEWHSEMGINKGKRICIIGAKFINHNAERTLLKIIEEPALNTHFFLVVPNSLVLLDTLRSRTHIVTTLNNSNNDFEKMAKEFISFDNKNRIDFLAKIIKEYKDEENSSKLRFIAIKFINEIEKIVFNKFKKDKKNKNIHSALEELQKSREFLNLPGASIKMILENLVFMI